MKIRFIVLLLGIALTLFNCQKDDIVSQHSKQNIDKQFGYTVSTIHSNIIDENKSLKEKLNLITDSLKNSKSNTQNKSVYSSEYDFFIDTNYATYLESADSSYHSYTFPIHRLVKTDSIENLLVSLQEDGSYKSMLVTYNTTAQEREAIENGLDISLVDKTSITVIDDANLMSNIFDKITTSECVSIGRGPCDNGYIDEHQPRANGDGGTCSGSTSIITVDFDCVSGGGGVTGENDEAPPSYSYDYEVHNAPNTGNGTYIDATSTTVTATQPWEIIMDYITFSPDDSLSSITHLIEDKAFATQVLSFIEDNCPDNTCSTEIEAFVLEGIKADEEGGEVDFDEQIIYTISKSCQKEIVKEVISISSDFTDLISDTFGESDKVSVKFFNGNTPNGQPAKTNPFYSAGTNGGFIINIQFDDAYLDEATNLSIVAVALHELSHAYFISLYLQGILVATDSEYETLMNAFTVFYANRIISTFDPLESEIHNAMEDFIEQIANTIYFYAQQNDIDVTPGFCRGLAWGTMHGTELFEEVLTETQQEQAQNIIITEQNNTEYGPAFPVEGTPCD